jgi:hypothetical protein
VRELCAKQTSALINAATSTISRFDDSGSKNWPCGLLFGEPSGCDADDIKVLPRPRVAFYIHPKLAQPLKERLGRCL